jgi:hypothetical protein
MQRYEEAISAWQDAATIYCETGDHHGEGMRGRYQGSIHPQ